MAANMAYHATCGLERHSDTQYSYYATKRRWFSVKIATL